MLAMKELLISLAIVWVAGIFSHVNPAPTFTWEADDTELAPTLPRFESNRTTIEAATSWPISTNAIDDASTLEDNSTSGIVTDPSQGLSAWTTTDSDLAQSTSPEANDVTVEPLSVGTVQSDDVVTSFLDDGMDVDEAVKSNRSSELVDTDVVDVETTVTGDQTTEENRQIKNEERLEEIALNPKEGQLTTAATNKSDSMDEDVDAEGHDVKMTMTTNESIVTHDLLNAMLRQYEQAVIDNETTSREPEAMGASGVPLASTELPPSGQLLEKSQTSDNVFESMTESAAAVETVATSEAAPETNEISQSTASLFQSEATTPKANCVYAQSFDQLPTPAAVFNVEAVPDETDKAPDIDLPGGEVEVDLPTATTDITVSQYSIDDSRQVASTTESSGPEVEPESEQIAEAGTVQPPTDGPETIIPAKLLRHVESSDVPEQTNSSEATSTALPVSCLTSTQAPPISSVEELSQDRLAPSNAVSYVTNDATSTSPSPEDETDRVEALQLEDSSSLIGESDVTSTAVGPSETQYGFKAVFQRIKKDELERGPSSGDVIISANQSTSKAQLIQRHSPEGDAVLLETIGSLPESSTKTNTMEFLVVSRPVEVVSPGPDAYVHRVEPAAETTIESNVLDESHVSTNAVTDSSTSESSDARFSSNALSDAIGNLVRHLVPSTTENELVAESASTASTDIVDSSQNDWKVSDVDVTGRNDALRTSNVTLAPPTANDLEELTTTSNTLEELTPTTGLEQVVTTSAAETTTAGISGELFFQNTPLEGLINRSSIASLDLTTVATFLEQHNSTHSPTHQSLEAKPSGAAEKCSYGGREYVVGEHVEQSNPCHFCVCVSAGYLDCYWKNCPPSPEGCVGLDFDGVCDRSLYVCPIPKKGEPLPFPVNSIPASRRRRNLNADKLTCDILGVEYKVGELVGVASDPCMECRCALDSLYCSPKCCFQPSGPESGHDPTKNSRSSDVLWQPVMANPLKHLRYEFERHNAGLLKK